MPRIQKSSTVLSLLIWFFLFVFTSEAQISESAAIKYAQMISVAKLDSGLAAENFESWLTKTIGKKASVTWELNDCGEQTGDSAIDSRRDLPICLGAYADLPDGRKVGIMILVSTQSTGNLAYHDIYYAYVEAKGVVHSARRLRDIETFLQQTAAK